jgi:hypothetical protein
MVPDTLYNLSFFFFFGLLWCIYIILVAISYHGMHLLSHPTLVSSTLHGPF